MLSKLNEKTKLVHEKEQLILELMNIMNKFKSQLHMQDDLMKLASNKLYTDAMMKINSPQVKSNNNIENLHMNTLVKSKK